MSKSSVFLCVIICLGLLTSTTKCELYTAIVDLEELLQTEAVLIDTLQGYIQAQEKKLELLRRYVTKIFIIKPKIRHLGTRQK